MLARRGARLITSSPKTVPALLCRTGRSTTTLKAIISRSFHDTQADRCAHHYHRTSGNNPSFVLEKAHSTYYEDRPVPELQDPHDVLVNVKYTGICGSDVHYWTHGGIGSYIVEAPMVLGHESSGIVSKIGSAVTSLKPGDRVCMEPGTPCRRCSRCKEGHYNLCPDMIFAATPPHHGTLARYYRLPEDYCYKLADNVSLEEGAIVEPLAVAVHITRQACVTPGQSVVVFGAGPVGLLCMAVAKAFGAIKIIAVETNEQRLQFAEEYAATHLFRASAAGVSSEDNAAAMIKKCGLGAGADVAIDATGAQPCIQSSIHALRVGGTFVQGGMGKPDIDFPIGAACAKELTIKGSFRYSAGDYALAVKLIESGKVDAKRMITGCVPFENASEAFENVKNGKGIKTLIRGPEGA